MKEIKMPRKTTKIRFECDWCNKAIWLTKYKYARSKQHFCGLGCYGQWKASCNKKRRFKCECASCGKVLYIPKWQFNRAENSFCSVACHVKWQQKDVCKVSCDYCKEIIVRNANELIRRKLHFCNQDCFNKYFSERRKGHNSTSWKNGRHIAKDGYVFIYKPEYSKSKSDYVLEHRYIMSEHLGRKLEADEIVHHLNGVRHDNRIENLMVVSRKTHENRTVRKKYIQRIIELEDIVKGIYACPN